MKLLGELKEKVEKAETMKEKKEIIEEAGVALTDDELDQVAGGTTQEFSDGYNVPIPVPVTLDPTEHNPPAPDPDSGYTPPPVPEPPYPGFVPPVSMP